MASSLSRKFLRKLVHIGLARAARTESGRQFVEQLVEEAQGHLGIGTGSQVHSSGEEAVFALVKQRSDPASPLCIFDVGANQGQYLRLIQQHLAGVPCSVHCFEPSPTTFKILAQNAGDRAGVTLNPFGLGREAGEFDLHSDAEGSGLASLSHRRLDHFGIQFSRRERVELRTLDAYCAANGVDRIDLLKLDVEGHELDALRGGARTFAERRVRAVTFEFGGCNIDSRTFFQDFYYFLVGHGLTSIFRILPNGTLARIPSYRESLEQFRTMNFLALLDDEATVRAPAGLTAPARASA